MAGLAGIVAAVIVYQLTDGRWRWLWALLAFLVVGLGVYELTYSG